MKSGMFMAKAIRIHAHGGPEALCWEDISVGNPGPGQVRLRHTAIGLNYIDVYHRTGLYPVKPLPAVIGMEGAGIVEALGPDAATCAPGLAVGDRVAYAGGPLGAYATHRLFPADRLVKLPAGVTDDEAAAVMLQGMTAEYLLHRTFRVQTGQTVLFHAIAGGVGLLACQWLKQIGARVIGTTSTAEKAALARSFGCDHVILYGQEDVAARVRELTAGQGVPVVYDSVGASTFQASLESLAPRGMLVSFGNASGPVPPFDPGLLAQKGSLYFTRPTLVTYTALSADLQASAAAVFAAMARGMKITIGQRFPLSQTAEAHRALEGRQTVGASLLLPD